VEPAIDRPNTRFRQEIPSSEGLMPGDEALASLLLVHRPA